MVYSRERKKMITQKDIQAHLQRRKLLPVVRQVEVVRMFLRVELKQDHVLIGSVLVPATKQSRD